MIVPLADCDEIVQIVNEPEFVNGFYYRDETENFTGPFKNDEEAYAMYKQHCKDLEHDLAMERMCNDYPGY